MATDVLVQEWRFFAIPETEVITKALLPRLTEEDVLTMIGYGRHNLTVLGQMELAVLLSFPAFKGEKLRSLMMKHVSSLDFVCTVWDQFGPAELDEFVASRKKVVCQMPFARSVCRRQCITPRIRQVVAELYLQKRLCLDEMCLYAAADESIFPALAAAPASFAANEAVVRQTLVEHRGWSAGLHRKLPLAVQQQALTVMMCLRSSIPIRHLLYIILGHALVSQEPFRIFFKSETVDCILHLLRS